MQDTIWVACKTGRDFITASPLCHCEHCYCDFRAHGVFAYVYFVNGSGLLILFEECLSALTCVIKTYAAQLKHSGPLFNTLLLHDQILE